METLLPLLIFVRCALMMVMMMRAHGHGQQEKSATAESTAELRTRRDEIDRMIEEREREGARTA